MAILSKVEELLTELTKTVGNIYDKSHIQTGSVFAFFKPFMNYI